ncbi:hypothetical protein TIFTF001_010475 [Ficus carica]|uniref:GDSL esterase/lipase n=1 Tax=Ficus carica TaxID=3494 RepID=A0AA87ZRT4_FICCA|nr:hypothetical protein TIFTF001_010475 [Ficus carica]
MPAVFAFGDSTVDSGNNNGVATIIRAIHPPYGQDFPGHVPSGRFSNGKLTTDFLVSSLGIKELLPAYHDPRLTDSDLVTGVSFASSGSGLDDAMSEATGARNLVAQMRDFDEAMKRIERAVGRNASQELVRDSVFVISAGTNDILCLYKRGARKFGVAGLPPVGCLPLQGTVGSIMPSPRMLQRRCVRQQNIDSQAYNFKLQHLLSNLHSSLPGFEQTVQACCCTGLLELGPFCNSHLPMCSDVSKYLFWDSMHTTQAAYSVITGEFLQNVLQLA